MVKFVMLCSQRVNNKFWLLSFNFLNEWFPINVSSVRDNKLKNLNSSKQSQDTLDQINKVWAQNWSPAVAAATAPGPDTSRPPEKGDGAGGEGEEEGKDGEMSGRGEKKERRRRMLLLPPRPPRARAARAPARLSAAPAAGPRARPAPPLRPAPSGPPDCAGRGGRAGAVTAAVSGRGSAAATPPAAASPPPRGNHEGGSLRAPAKPRPHAALPENSPSTTPTK